MKFVYSILGLVIGTIILRYSAYIYRYIGKSDTAERILGGGFGGTYTAILLFGAAIVLGSLMFLLGVL